MLKSLAECQLILANCLNLNWVQNIRCLCNKTSTLDKTFSAEVTSVPQTHIVMSVCQKANILVPASATSDPQTSELPQLRVGTICRHAQAALRKMYKVFLGNSEPPEDVTPAFIEDELSGVGSAQQQQAERRRLFMVGMRLRGMRHCKHKSTTDACIFW